MQIKEVITGELIPIEQNITGALSTVDATIIGELKTSEMIVGTMTPIDIVSGDITIPPEKYIDPYMGEYVIKSDPFKDEIYMTKNHSMTKNLTVLKIPYYETSNETGYTVYIGGE